MTGEGLKYRYPTKIIPLMPDHVSTLKMEKFCARSLEISELASVAEHLEACTDCRELFHEIFQRRRDYAPIAFNLSPEAWLKHEHLEHEQLVPYVEDRLSEAEREILDAHLRSCNRCRERYDSFLDFRKQIEPEMSVRFAPRRQPIIEDKPRPVWDWFVTGWKPVTAFAVVAVVAGMIIATALLLRQNGAGEQQVAKQINTPRAIEPLPSPQVNTSDLPSLSSDENVRSIAGEVTKRVDANTEPVLSNARRTRTRVGRSTENPASSGNEVISLNDGQRKVVIGESGEISGLSNIPSETEQAIREVLLAQDMKRPESLASITGEKAALRGTGADEKIPFRLVSPERVVVIEDRPVFKWEPLENATSYQVHVVDANNREVATSPTLPSTTTEWTPAASLKRGVVYTWIVGAMVGNEEVTSPTGSVPEMRFKVLEAERLSELNRLKNSNSHLALGVFFARAGMIKEAEREFQVLLNDNPRSTLALKLLRTVKSWH